MVKPAGPHRWVLEGFHDQTFDRWDLDGLEAEIVLEHLGFLPEGLGVVEQPFFDYLMARYGFDEKYSDFDDVLIGMEQTA